MRGQILYFQFIITNFVLPESDLALRLLPSLYMYTVRIDITWMLFLFFFNIDFSSACLFSVYQNLGKNLPEVRFGYHSTRKHYNKSVNIPNPDFL